MCFKHYTAVLRQAGCPGRLALAAALLPFFSVCGGSANHHFGSEKMAGFNFARPFKQTSPTQGAVWFPVEPGQHPPSHRFTRKSTTSIKCKFGVIYKLSFQSYQHLGK